MAGEYSYHRIEENDLESVSELINEVLSVDIRVDHWRDKYFRNPAGDARSAVVVQDGKVVGQIGSIPIRFRVNGGEVIAVQELDVAMYESHRRFDVFLRLANAQSKIYEETDVDFSFTFSIGTTSEIARIFNVSKKVSQIPRLIKVLDTDPLLKKKLSAGPLSRVVSPAANMALRLKYGEKTKIPDGMKLKKVARFDERFDAFWERIKDDYPIMTIRSAVYLNWRYVDAALIDYEIVALEEAATGAIAGFVVLGESDEGYTIGQIFDVVTPREGSESITRCLVSRAIDRFREKKAAMAKCWFYEHCHVYPVLDALGFAPRLKEGRDVLFTPYGSTAPCRAGALGKDQTNWFLAKGDSDNY